MPKLCRRTCSAIGALLLAVLTGCGGYSGGELLTGTLRVEEGIGRPQPEGTLILMELITPLTRQQTLTRFAPADLRQAGLQESDVQDGSAVFAVPWHQRGGLTTGAFALVASSLRPKLNSGPSKCNARGDCSYGGDVVAIRVIRAGPRPLYQVDFIAEARTASGDCYYVRTAGKEMIYCKSLEAKGWIAKDGLFMKSPDAPAQK